MERNTNLYSFPFQKIHNFLDTGVDKKLEDFYNLFQNQFFGQRIMLIDKVKMEVQMYKDSYLSNELPYTTYTFEEEIKFLFLGLIYESFDTIHEALNIFFISNQSISNYLDKLERQYQSLLRHPKSKEFPFLKNSLVLIDNEIKRYERLDGVKEENAIFSKSPFEPKVIKITFFHRLYDVAIDHELIEYYFPKEDFIEVFTSSSTNKQIIFTCKSSFLIAFFESIKDLFDNLNQTSIGDSNRFLTKQRRVFSTTNYSTSKKRFVSNNKIKQLQEDLEDLISEYQ